MPNAPPKHIPPGMKPWAQRREEFDKARGPSSQRGYDSAWRKCRALFLLKHPKCVVCNARAVDVDHVLSIAERPDLRLSWSNLRSMCHEHHSQRTARDQGFANPERRNY